MKSEHSNNPVWVSDINTFYCQGRRDIERKNKTEKYEVLSRNLTRAQRVTNVELIPLSHYAHIS